MQRLTRAEVELAADRADTYPPGFGIYYVTSLPGVMGGELAKRLAAEPSLVEDG